MPRRSRPGLPPKRGHNRHRVELGVYSLYNATRFETEVESRGGTLTWHRIYYQTQSWSGMGQVSTDAAAGYKVYFSFKGNGTTWEQIAAGNEDARWTGIGNGLAAVSNAGAWCFNHEPENDRATFGSDANGDAFVAAFERIAGIIKPLAPAWKASICLFDEVFPSYEFSRGGNWVATPDPNHWISSECDLLGVDYYWYRGASDGGSHWATNDNPVGGMDYNTALTEYITYANAFGISQICIPEFGCTIRDPGVTPGDETKRTDWIQAIADDWHGDSRLDSVMYFEVSDEDQADKGNYSITDDDHPPMSSATVQAFADIGV